jgi:hypothetical protein
MLGHVNGSLIVFPVNYLFLYPTEFCAGRFSPSHQYTEIPLAIMGITNATIQGLVFFQVASCSVISLLGSGLKPNGRVSELDV